jgi:RNA polymerase sigma factor (sigma-70 family)
MEPVLQVIRRLSAETTDDQLLDRYAAGDQEAFAQLVERHGRLVLGVCRRILNNAHDAEDAFQAVFILLARKARSLREPDRLSAWLHGVAVRVARKARSLRQRQQERDQARPVPGATDPENERILAELLLIMDEQLHTLPARYRVPLILHHLEGLTQAETARHLSCPAGTIAARLSRGRELLRRLLERRGVTLPAATVTALLARAEAASASLLLLTLIQGTAGLAGASAASGTVQTLVNGVTTTMMLERIRRMAITVALVLVGLAGTGWVATSEGRVPPRTTDAGPGDPPKIPPAPQEVPPPPLLPAPPPQIIPPAVAVYPMPTANPSTATAITKNFSVRAPSQRMAILVASAAEKERAELARKWLGKELPDWTEPCPVWVRSDSDILQRYSVFQFEDGKVKKREMHLTGALEQLLAEQLPHEVMHTILADHFGQAIPRWADEGIAQLAEDETSQQGFRANLYAAIARVGRLPLAPQKFLAAKDYPNSDLVEFNAMCHGLCEFLSSKSNDRPRARLLDFVAEGLKVADGDWGPVVKKFYGLGSVKELEDAWLAALKKHLPKEDSEVARLEKLVPSVQPELVVAKLSGDGQFLFISRAMRYCEPMTTYRQEGGTAHPVTSYRMRNAVTRQVLPVEGLTVRTAGGKILTTEHFRERLKEETLIFWQPTDEPLPESYVKLLREGTLILNSPPPAGPTPPVAVPPVAVPTP